MQGTTPRSSQYGLFQPVDAASLAICRIVFGSIMLAWSASLLLADQVSYYYIQPRFHFPYHGFDWVYPLPGIGMPLVFVAISVLSVLILLGVRYRLAAVLFAALFAYVFLIDKATYQNHYYFVCLMSFLMAVVPANRAFSLDARLHRSAMPGLIPRWALWLIRFQVGVVYFYGGIAKLSNDWIHGAPILEMLSSPSSRPFWGAFVGDEAAVQLIVWGGLLFDLLIVPALLWKRTRVIAFGLCLFFHLSNALMFSIGIFPWLMIGVTTIFFEPDWPRRLLRIPAPNSRISDIVVPSRWWQQGVVTLLVLWCSVQVTVPLRHFFYAGDVNWTERGHLFSWHMMLRGKRTAIRFHIQDPATGRTGIFPLEGTLKLHQVLRMSRDPVMIRDFARYIQSECHKHGFSNVQVRAFVLCSLNGRRPQLLVSPDRDLTSPALHADEDWVIPLTEPLRSVPWTAPLNRWESLVMQDPLLGRDGLPSRSSNGPDQEGYSK